MYEPTYLCNWYRSRCQGCPDYFHEYNYNWKAYQDGRPSVNGSGTVFCSHRQVFLNLLTKWNSTPTSIVTWKYWTTP